LTGESQLIRISSWFLRSLFNIFEWLLFNFI
jgi:hypothetical protein